MSKWKLPKPSHMQECIEHWRTLDMRRATDAEIKASLVELRDKIRRSVAQRLNSSHSNLWRVRRSGARFESPSDFWSPRRELTNQGRCNIAGEPVLYCARSAITAIEEMDLNVGEDIVLINYESRNIRLSRVVGRFDPNPEDGERILEGDDLCSYRILREFLFSEFTKPVGAGTEFLYRFSAAVCRVWTSDDSDGWLYPSVKSFTGENVALKPSAANEKLRIKQACLAEVLNLSEAVGMGVAGVTLRQKATATVDSTGVSWVEAEGVHRFLRPA